MPDSTVEQGEKDYAAEDILGQAGLTNAVFDWIEDASKPAPTNLGVSSDEWTVILAGYLSSVEARPVEMADFDPPDGLLERFKRFAGA